MDHLVPLRAEAHRRRGGPAPARIVTHGRAARQRLRRDNPRFVTCRRSYAESTVLSQDASCYIDWVDPGIMALLPLVTNPRRYFQA
jgi:hypothetical protein